MDRDIIKKAVLIPVITGIVFGVLFTTVFSSRVNAMMPFNEGAQLASHEQLELPEAAEASSVCEAKKNERIGASVNGKELVKEADYALLSKCVSVEEGSNELQGSGCRYLKTLNCYADDFAELLTVDYADGTQQYFGYVEGYSVSSEQEALAVAPLGNSSVVIYYQERDGAGLSTAYHVSIYEEVA